MGKTQDALAGAEAASEKLPQEEPFADRGPLGAKVPLVRGGVAEQHDLESSLLGLDRNGKAKRLLLIHTAEDSGPPGHALRLAASLATGSDLRILVLDLSRWALSFSEAFGRDQPTGLFDLFSGGHATTSPIQKVGPGELYTARLTADHPRLVDFFESGEADKLFTFLGADFDFVVLEIPGGAPFSECRTLCSQADAVALVVEAGVGADQLALDARRLLGNPAEKLVGLVVHETKTRRRWLGALASATLAAVVLFGLAYWLEGFSGGRSVDSAAVSGVQTTPDSLLLDRLRTQQERVARPNPVLPRSVTKPVEQTPPEPPAAMKEVAQSAKPVEQTPPESPAAMKEVVQSAKPAGPVIEPVKTADAQTAIVAAGDNLYRIILANYGAYSGELVDVVLEANPEISSAGQIAVGQAIRLPRLE